MSNIKDDNLVEYDSYESRTSQKNEEPQDDSQDFHSVTKLNRMWVYRRTIAFISLAGIFISFSLIFGIPVEQLHFYQPFIESFQFIMASFVGAYVGLATAVELFKPKGQG